MSIDKATRINERIRVREVRLIESDGSQAGIVPIEEALRRSQEQLLDLVEVAPTAKPPVCRIMDFGKFLYQAKKKAHDSKKKQKIIHVKEVKFRPNIDEHDYDFKLRNVVRFLEDGDKVKATVQFRGREMARTDLGVKLLQRMSGDVGERGVLESGPEMAGNRMHVIMGPPKNQQQPPPPPVHRKSSSEASAPAEPATSGEEKS